MCISLFLNGFSGCMTAIICSKLKFIHMVFCDIPWYLHSFPRDSFIVNISMHFGATLEVACSGCHSDLVSYVRGGAGRALCGKRLLSRSLYGDFN